MEKNFISKRINKNGKTNKIPHQDYKNVHNNAEKSTKHAGHASELNKNDELENVSMGKCNVTPLAENAKKNLKSPKSKQRKLVRSPEISLCDSIFGTKSNSISLFETKTSNSESLISPLLSQNIAMGSDISSTTIKTTSIEKTSTEELFNTSKNNTTNSIFDYIYDKSTIISTTISTLTSSLTTATTTTTTITTTAATTATTTTTTKTSNDKSLSSDQVNSIISDSINRITPVASSSNIFLNVDNTNNKSDSASVFFEASGNTSSSDLGSGNFNSITGTISSGSYYSDDYEFSILSNLNIDSEISDITTHSNSYNINAPPSSQPSCYQQQQSKNIELINASSTNQDNDLQKQQSITSSSPSAAIITTNIKDKSNTVSNNVDNSPPMRLADYDDPIGSDLSTSASTKLTSTNTSFSGESYTGGSMEAPPSPTQRYQNFIFRSSDSNKSFETQTSPQLPVPPPVPRRSFQIQIERRKNIENTIISPTVQRKTPPNLSRSQTPDKNLSARMNVCQLTSPNNPFLPEIIANRYTTDDEQDENVLSPTLLKNYHLSAEELNIIDHSKLSGSSVSPDVTSTSSGGEKIISEFYSLTDTTTINKKTEGSQSYHGGLASNSSNFTSSSTKYKKIFTSSSSSVENKNHLNLKESSNNTKSAKSTKFSPQNSFKRNLNPFSKYYNESSTTSKDLHLKREEFLKATMRICLVVSPPSTKLHVKSKSLTHLDVLSYPINDSSNNTTLPDQPVPNTFDAISPQSQAEISLYREPILIKTKPAKDFQSQDQKNSTSNITATSSLPLYQHHPSSSVSTGTTNSTSTCNKICCLGKTAPSSTDTSNTNDHYDSNRINHKTVSSTALAAASLNAVSIHHIGGSICNSSPHLIQITTQQSPNVSSGPTAASTFKTGSIKKKSTFLLSRTKPGSSKSEVSSSEYFSVHFHIENGAIEEELIQIKKGVTLLGALDSSLKRRNLTISQINITDSNIHSLAETGSPPYGSLIDENIDTESLLGKILIVTEKNDSYLKSSKLGSLQKAASFGSRARPPRLLSSASTEETSSEPDPKVIPAKQLKQRWSGLFGVKNPQQNQLCELLSKFSKSGGPPKKYSIQLEQPAFETDALNYLQNSHKCWREFIYYDDLSDNEIKIQSAIWELVTTEIDYIHTLQTVTDLFLACLEALQEENILTDVDQNKLFSNIREICEANLKFWTSYLYPMVANSIANRTPLHIDYFEQGFVTFGLAFSPYKVYCAEQSTCQFYCKELNRTNTVFTTYLAWCESQKNCNRLRLADILVRPMQRLTKYSLLLIAIRKNVIFENDGEMLDSMIRSVENFVYSVNTHLSTRQENERLKGIMARIESYDVVETNNEQLEKFVKQYSQMFDLCAPMKGCSTQHCRHLFMEGDLKLKDSVSKSDVHCFLLTDILLICKTISKKSQGALKVIRQPYFTDRLMIKHKDNSLYCVYLNEFQVATSAFSLQCSEAKNWHDGITKAKHIYTRLKQNIQWDINLRGYNQSSSGDNVNMLGVKKSPLNSSRGSRVSSLNNSHSGSVELNDSKNISVDLEKANSLSSDEGANFGNQNTIQKTKSSIAVSPQKQKAVTANTLSVQPLHSLGQSLPNLTSPQNQVSCNLYHTYSNNTLLVPGYGRGCPSNNLLSPSHRGISYPPPSPTRGTLRRGFAFSSTIKNPPLVKTRNITSQNSVNWYQTILPKTATQQQQEGISHFPGLLSLASSESAVSPNQVQNTYPSKETTKATSLNTTFDVTPQQATNESDV